MSLRERLVAEIGAEGPLSIARYMELCLHDPAAGYYATRPRLGEAGDFITAPHVSQMFGEVLGAWTAQVWVGLGRPARFNLIELGPGEGLMIEDMLRALRAAPDCLAACRLWLVEPSLPLRARQEARLGGEPEWIGGLDEAPPDAPAVVLANEVLDCLPIRQAVRTGEGWRERRVGATPGGELDFVVGERVALPRCVTPQAAIVEWSDAAQALGRAMGEFIAEVGGAALAIDYGTAAGPPGDTLQALKSHQRVHPLAEPGACDLTAHADFAGFLAGAAEAGVETLGPLAQGRFLRALGIEVRADALARSRPDQADKLLRQLRRLVGADEMGELFKVVCLRTPGLPIPGFDA